MYSWSTPVLIEKAKVSDIGDSNWRIRSNEIDKNEVRITLY